MTADSGLLSVAMLSISTVREVHAGAFIAKLQRAHFPCVGLRLREVAYVRLLWRTSASSTRPCGG